MSRASGLPDAADAPPELLEAAERALATADASRADADRLAEAGLERLRHVMSDPSDRPAAFDLLTADALLTWACEAAAERGPDALDALTRRLGPGRFHSLLDPEAP